MKEFLKGLPTDNILEYIQATYLGKKVEGSRSPAGNWMEFTLEKIEKGMAEISLEVKHDMTNPYSNIHGGMMALVMDETIGWAVLSLGMENNYTSLNLNVDFLYAIQQGKRLKSRAKVIRAGKKIVHVECEVLDMNDTLLGKASSNLIVTSMKPQSNNPFNVAS
ncbi:MAG TPA: PaaI family thioesterase [Flavipsychrobacter sp.]|nr:PaaI family thioesterase [Flavipsychrobacter sp.]